MISKSIAKGTVVFHESFGLGRFVKFTNHRERYNENVIVNEDADFAIVQFEDEKHIIHRKRLTEIED